MYPTRWPLYKHACTHRCVRYHRVNLYTQEGEWERERDSWFWWASRFHSRAFIICQLAHSRLRTRDRTRRFNGRPTFLFASFSRQRFSIYLSWGGLRAGGGLSFSCGGGGGPPRRRIPLRWRRRACTRCFTEFITNRKSNRSRVSGFFAKIKEQQKQNPCKVSHLFFCLSIHGENIYIYYNLSLSIVYKFFSIVQGFRYFNHALQSLGYK